MYFKLSDLEKSICKLFFKTQSQAVFYSALYFLLVSPGVPPPAALGGVSDRTRRSFCRIRFVPTPRGLAGEICREKGKIYTDRPGFFFFFITKTQIAGVSPFEPVYRTKERDLDEALSTFAMNGATNVSTSTQTVHIKADPEEWNKEDLLTLLDRIKGVLPEQDCMKYKTTESHFDWEKVRFGLFTGDMCKQRWQKLSCEVRKFRTMTELIIDALELVKNPYKGKKLKTHPDFPKKPLTPYFRFFMEKRAKYAKIHPEMSNLDLTKILSKKYKELPEKKKLKYIQEFQQEKEEFEKAMTRFRVMLFSRCRPIVVRSQVSSLCKALKLRLASQEVAGITNLLRCRLENGLKLLLFVLQVSPKELKEALRRQWSQLSDKKRLKWISKALELQKDYEASMRAYQEAHPESTLEETVKSVLTKAERQLKDKFDGRPTKPPPNGYSLYCAELMVNMKDVPSTERMVLCSKQWKIMSQKDKDSYQKRCEQKKKQYETDLQRFLESLPDEERDRVLIEEKLGSSRMGPQGQTISPLRAKSPSSKKYKDAEKATRAEQVQRMQNLVKDKRDSKRKVKLPETPKTAEEMWQQSIIGDYLAKYRNDRKKAQVAMEATWNAMEKKEKIPWIKKAAEDQKRYERELAEIRSPMAPLTQKKPKFDGEPKKPPMSGYQMFSQELLTNGELNHFSLKERMVEIGKRWHKLSQSQKDKYKKMVEEQQIEYKAELEAWIKSLSPHERAIYKEYSSVKRRNTTKSTTPAAKVRVPAKGKQESSDSEDDEEEKSDSSDSDDEEEEDSSASSDSDEEEDEDDNEGEEENEEDDDDQSEASSSSSTGESSDSDSD
nr:PREDICTED: nucleolar transcription factor 1-A-like [Latimeria chalumnae]|eukprot:XP_014347912.1 PREDICTED: nucleolar transcription factor 1-A-like [Latimeria chalumnae]